MYLTLEIRVYRIVVDKVAIHHHYHYNITYVCKLRTQYYVCIIILSILSMRFS